MSLTLHTLKPAQGSKRKSKRLGRGNASGKGTTAGFGGKGQTARTGSRGGLKLLGMRRLIMSTPKLRGFKSARPKKAVVSLSELDRVFNAGEAVTPAELFKKGLTFSAQTPVKILGDGKLTKKLTVKGCAISEGAKQKILAAGGQIK